MDHDSGCKRCQHDQYNALRICRAEKGTKITLFEEGEAKNGESAVEIEILKNFDGGCRGAIEYTLEKHHEKELSKSYNKEICNIYMSSF